MNIPTLRWIDRAGTILRPAFLVSTSNRYWIFRFGIEEYVTFTERNQGKNSIPVKWHYFFGKRLSIKYERLT